MGRPWRPQRLGMPGRVCGGELAEPLVCPGRWIKASSGGAGKYRGGCGFQSLRMVWNAKD
ncbi:hypothetical protein APZ41_020530 [Roseomonas mucosa]|uniref:Uncharacterized protein n=1 Tax=Roseomonas mucosa TaxID=207340 RepID=A0A1S8CZE4_9PROT|nr:hypothetical protein APZ41_020530 [Roseomonas mucosa]